MDPRLSVERSEQANGLRRSQPPYPGKLALESQCGLGEVGRIDAFHARHVLQKESVVIGISHDYKLQGDLHFILFILLEL